MNQATPRLGKKQHATIREVAEMAGVSQMTVSRVLNRRESVKESTREKVEEAIQALNYRPNLLARSLAGGKSLFIGLIFNNPSNNYLGELLVGTLNRCREAGHHLVIEDFSITSRDKEIDALIERISGAGLDGVIVAPPVSEDELILSKLHAAGLRTVLIAPREAPNDGVSVSIDDAAAADQMTQYLIDHGHKRIAFVIGATDQSSSRRRYRGFDLAMARNGLSVDDNLVQQGDYTYRSGLVAGEHFFSLPQPPSAVFASNDDMAAGVLAAAQRHGMRVPEDVSIVGFDDTAIASAMWPQLTTVRQPIAEMAYQAVNLLARVIGDVESPKKDRNLVLDVAIVERDTVRKA
ncbi:LacI family DNA-binding transcriptional regulator [Hyphomonas sp.]|uniref:LacI family DNA-binding transcriptional regulator n=1 Tax=Hyphomonas sp. TaxID=87 RepID=UPI0035283A0E